MRPSSADDKQRSNFVNVNFGHQVRTLQIVRGALIVGVTAFLAIVLGLVAGMPQKLEFGLFEIILIFVAVQSLALYFLAPTFAKIPEARQAEIRAMTSAEKEMALMPFVTSVEIIRGAAIEGASFFALILVIIADSKVGLFVGVALIALAIAVFPTEGRIRSRVEDLRYKLGL